ncbi:hypothetical protein MU582_05710 [Nocardioidaceae bacterium SCSIO 66511]|nr:hypothetical protein MU582_05710 [Nocardioidaceae bacterium SCSIO 66511]
MHITKVQQWIAAGMLGAFGFALAASLSYSAWLMLDRDKPGNAWGLWVMGLIVGVLVMVGARLIHKVSPLSLWLLAGTIPALVGLPFLIR